VQSFPLKAVGVTFSGCCLSLAAALPIGSEGPMIHIGAMIASNITRMGALPRW
jgi:H+/Cl- antiporter ClcA